MPLPDIESFHVGQSVSFSHQISQRDIDRFVELTGDDNPMHVDAAFAAETQVKTPVAHGMLTASFISTVIGKHLPGPGALWVSQKIEFLSPVRVGDRIEIAAEIRKLHVGNRLLTIGIDIRNHLNRAVIRGECVVRWPEPAVETPAAAPAPGMRVALVTGASRGIGAEIAKRLAAQGYFVYINYQSSQGKALAVLDEIRAAGGNGELVRGDAFDEKAVQQIFSEIRLRHQRLDLLVNNAAPSIHETDFFELDWEQFSSQFLPPVRSMFLCIKEALPLFETAGGGAVINIGSVVVDYDPPAKWLGYNLGKGCIHLMTRNLAASLGSKGVRINTVAPGLTETDMTVDMPERQRMLLKMKTPSGRLAAPSDIAATVAFLAGEGAGQISGQVLRVNGGIF
ncbi:SDR family oxidoreductase [Massilia sp. SM-13]|uniref:SDR family oxidoreductase n=1 Tax=Pseudoduganella rhizocola TaxID=3382643 RepID=UPI0038B4A3E5